MSESVSAPVADAPAADAPAPISPAPSSQPGISISDAARMLRGARQPAQADAAPRADAAPAAEPAEAPKRTSGVEAMERALGLKPGDAPADTPEATDAPAAPAADGYEFDGRRLSEAELRQQLSMAKDYTYKTQQMAQERAALQAQQDAINQFLPLIQPQVMQLQAMLANAPAPQPELRMTDPATYWDQFARHQEAIQAHQQVFAMMQQQEQGRLQAQTRATEAGNAELAQKYPFWADPAQRRDVQHAVADYARSKGFTDAELSGLTNPRYLEVLMEGMAYRRQMEKVTTSAPTPNVRAAPPRGAAPPPRPVEQVQAAAAAFDAKPDWRNGAALLSAQQAAGRRGNGHSNW